jgi:CRISPR-associated protein Cas4
MESYIQISKINDFLYSPRSLYLHGVYETFSDRVYHEKAQIVGRLNHENIENGTYSSAKRFLQGVPVYCEKYNLGGKIDIYDSLLKLLIERKTKIKNPHIHLGLKCQLWAQMFAMEEMGYQISGLRIQSLEDNKRYVIDKPTKFDVLEFEKVLKNMREYDFRESVCEPSLSRCDVSIYRHLSY